MVELQRDTWWNTLRAEMLCYWCNVLHANSFSWTQFSCVTINVLTLLLIYYNVTEFKHSICIASFGIPSANLDYLRIGVRYEMWIQMYRTCLEYLTFGISILQLTAHVPQHKHSHTRTCCDGKGKSYCIWKSWITTWGSHNVNGCVCVCQSARAREIESLIHWQAANLADCRILFACGIKVYRKCECSTSHSVEFSKWKHWHRIQSVNVITFRMLVLCLACNIQIEFDTQCV